MAKTLATVFGIIYVLLGLLAFVSNPLVGTNGFFAADSAHAIVWLIIGIVLLVAAFWAPMQAALWVKIVGVVAIIIALLGFFMIPSSGGTVLFWWQNGADNWLYLIVGIILLAGGIWGKSGMSSGMPAQRPM